MIAKNLLYILQSASQFHYFIGALFLQRLYVAYLGIDSLYLLSTVGIPPMQLLPNLLELRL